MTEPVTGTPVAVESAAVALVAPVGSGGEGERERDGRGVDRHGRAALRAERGVGAGEGRRDGLRSGSETGQVDGAGARGVGGRRDGGAARGDVRFADRHAAAPPAVRLTETDAAAPNGMRALRGGER